MHAELDTHEISLLGGKVRVADAVYDAELLEDLYSVLSQVLVPPSTVYVTNTLLKTKSECLDYLADYIPRALCMFLHLHLTNLSKRLSIEDHAEGGWEVWSRVSTCNSPSFGYLHVDNDELMRTRSGRLVSPHYGSILYVGPGAELSGGETAFIDPAAVNANQLFSALHPEDFAAQPFEYVKPIVGRLVVFDGEVPHAVMWTKGQWKGPRITFLANYWKTRISSLTPGERDIPCGDIED
jgi:hypothetical protein